MKNRRLSQSIKENSKRLDLNKSLLQHLLQEQEQLLQTKGAALHSSLSSKIHAINLVTFHLKKTQTISPAFEQSMHVLSETTKAALSEIDQLVSDMMPYTLQALGLVAALKDFVSNYSDRVSMQIEAIETPISSSKKYHLYQLLKAWIKEAIEEYQATHIQIVWKESKRLIYTDNGQYPPHFKRNDPLLSIRLFIVEGQLLEEHHSPKSSQLVLEITFTG